MFTVLVEKLPTFRYDPQKRFRAWLWTIIVNKARDRRRAVAPGALADHEVPEMTIPDPIAELAEPRNTASYLVRRALELIRADFQPTTWQAFWECVMTEQDAAVVAAKLGSEPRCRLPGQVSSAPARLRQDLAGLLD